MQNYPHQPPPSDFCVTIKTSCYFALAAVIFHKTAGPVSEKESFSVCEQTIIAAVKTVLIYCVFFGMKHWKTRKKEKIRQQESDRGLERGEEVENVRMKDRESSQLWLSSLLKD